MARKKEPIQDPQPTAEVVKPVHIEDQETIKSLLFSQVERPKNLCEVKIVNVFENRYRINLWIKIDEDGFEKKKIQNSYFVRYDGEKLDISA